MKKIIKKIFSKKVDKKKIEYAPKWIHIRLVMYFDGKVSKKYMIKIGEDVANIINNTHSVVGEDGKVIGYVNPYVGLNFVSISKSEKGMIKSVPNLYASQPDYSKDLSRTFIPVTKKNNKQWELIIVPMPNKKGANNLYSVEMLSHDIWPLAGATNIICERYNIPISEERPSFNPIIIHNQPFVEIHDHLFIITYSVADRLRYEKENQDAVKAVLGIGFKNFNELIDVVDKNQPNCEWIKAVRKLQKK